MNGPLLTYSLDACGVISLPGLGSFYAESQPAQIAFGDRAIFPATRLVRFEEGHAADSGKFSQVLVSDFGLSSLQAEEYIISLSNQVLKSLELNPTLHIAGFGIFQKNAAGFLDFTAEEGVPFFADSYGLPKLNAETLRSAIRHQVSREIPVIPLRPFDSIDPIHTKTTTKKSYGIRWVAAAAVVAALAVSSTSIWFIATQNQGASPVFYEPVAQEASIMPIAKKAETIVAEPVSAEKATPGKTEKSSSNKAVSKTRFFVISGSFKQTEKSSDLQKKLIHRGYDSHLLPNPEKGITRVSLGQFSSKEAALAFIRQAQELFDEQLWVMEQ